MKNKRIGFLVLVSMAMGCSMQPIPPTEDVMPRQDVSLTETAIDVAAMEASQDATMVADATDAVLDATPDAARDSALIQDSSMTDGSDAALDTALDVVLDAALEASRDAAGDSSDASRSDAMGDVVAEDSAAPSPRMDNVLYLTRDSRLLLYENTRYVREQAVFFEKLFLTLRYQDSGICTIAVFEFSDGVNHCRVLDSDGGRVFDPGGGGRIIVFDIDGGRDTIGTASPTYSGDYQFIGYHNDGGTLPPPGVHSYAVTIRPNPCFSTLSRVPGAVSVTISTSSSGGSGTCARSYVFPTVWSDAMRVSVER